MAALSLYNEYMEKITFEKVYTRDTSLIMQEIWARGCTTRIQQELGFANPHHPEIIHFINDGSIEIWENKQATSALMDFIVEANKKDAHFLDNRLSEYKQQLSDLRQYWDDGRLSDIEDFPDYLRRVNEAIVNFIAYYYSAVDDRTPELIRRKALKMRETDTFFATSDIFIRNSLIHFYPAIKGYETGVLSAEVKHLPQLAELRERRKHFTLINGIESQLEDLSDLEKRRPEFNFIFEKNEFPHTREFKGQSAFRGKVEGIVRMLRRRDQISDVKAGDIIVSPMTTPDFMPAMEVAAAFVTDEGGITCHAAIVARELKKPCIIGTKFATTLLKDGDRVEVDANQGIVRIL